MPSYDEVFAKLMEDAKAKVESEALSKMEEQQTRSKEVQSTLEQISTALPTIMQNQQTLNQRIAAMEAQNKNSNRQVDDNDPYRSLTEDLGITRQHFAPVVQHEVRNAVKSEVKSAFEEMLGPTMRESAAINEYQNGHPDFDLQRVNSYINKNPEVKKMVDKARQQGAFELGIEYAETRRVMDEKISKEALVQSRGDKRKRVVAETRPDAEIIGATGALGDRSKVTKTISANDLESVYAHANAGNWKPFENAFHKDHLPSEEEFQRIAQS